LAQWRALRDEVGKEAHRLDSRGDTFNEEGTCWTCKNVPNVAYQCIDCLYGDVNCHECLLRSHARHPFHIIKVSFAYLLSCLFTYLIMTVVGLARWPFCTNKLLRPWSSHQSWTPVGTYVPELQARPFEFRRCPREWGPPRSTGFL
jgi:hypothetical protein